MEEADLLNRGELDSALAGAAGIQLEDLDCDSANAIAFWRGDVVVAVAHDVLTKAEKLLAHNGSHDDISLFRGLARQATEAERRKVVERLTGRKVIAYFGAHNLEPDVAAEIFVLDTPV